MTTAIFLIGLLFIGVGFLVTEKNAKYLLSGYNTMPKSEREKIELKPFLVYFKKFHSFLGISVILIGIILTILNKNWVMPFLSIYPILAYIFFLWTSKQYFSQLKRSKTKTLFALIVLICTLFVMTAIFLKGNREDRLVLEKDKLTIEGFYGEVIPFTEIDSIALVNSLPKITKRTNGYAAGEVRKGYFQTEYKQRVKLILNSNEKPCLYIKTISNHKIYYSLRKEENQVLYNEIKIAINKHNLNHTIF